MQEIHPKTEVSQLMLDSYVHALKDVPIADLKVALLDTLRSVEYWPTPGHIRAKLDNPREYGRDEDKPARGCPDCDGTCWVPVTLKHPRTGRPYEAVTSCSCTSREPPTEKAKRPKSKKREPTLVAKFATDVYPD